MEMYFWSPLGNFRSGKERKRKQYNLCTMARYLPSIRIRAPESEHYFAISGQEILKLLGCKDICIEYFPEALHQKKGKTNSKYKNAPVLDNFCKSQKACYRKPQNGQVPRSPNWLISYFFWVKRHLFFSTSMPWQNGGSRHECLRDMPRL